MSAMNNSQDALTLRTAHDDYIHPIYARIPSSGRGNFTLAMRTFHERASHLTCYMVKFRLVPNRRRKNLKKIYSHGLNSMGPPDEFDPHYISRSSI